MSWKDILKEEKNKPYYRYLHELLSPRYGDDTDLAISEIQQKFTSKNLRDWNYASTNHEEWWIEPQDDRGINMLNNWRAVNKLLKKYGTMHQQF